MPTRLCRVKATVFPIVMYICEIWTIKKAERWRTDAFKLWCSRRPLRVPWTTRRSNQSIPEEINPGYSLEGLMLKLNSNALATWCKEPAYWKRPWYWKSESEVAQSCLTLCDSMDCSPPGSSVHGILQARILEWVAISFSRGSSRPRDWTQVSHIAGIRFNLRATREALDTGKDWGQKEKGPVLESVLYGRAIVSVSGLRVTSKRADTTYHTSQDCCC